MIKVKTVALTEKGQVKPDVRKEVANLVATNRDLFTSAEKVDGKMLFTLPIEDVDGNTFYVNYEVTVSNKPAAERAVRKSTPKAKVETESIEIELD